MPRRIPVKVRGVEYRSAAAAAKALGLAPWTVNRARAEGRLDSVGKGRQGRGRGLPVKLGDKTYPSVAEAARQTGISYWTLYEIARAA